MEANLHNFGALQGNVQQGGSEKKRSKLFRSVLSWLDFLFIVCNAALMIVYEGIGLVVAGHSVYWSYGYAQGFWEFFTSTLVTSVAYFALCLCLSEMISILPFSGMCLVAVFEY